MSGFLPDFRANRTIFLLVLLAELFAIILALSEADRLNDFWNRLALNSLFVQWVALGSAAVLALFQHLLKAAQRETGAADADSPSLRGDIDLLGERVDALAAYFAGREHLITGAGR